LKKGRAIRFFTMGKRGALSSATFAPVGGRRGGKKVAGLYVDGVSKKKKREKEKCPGLVVERKKGKRWASTE